MTAVPSVRAYPDGPLIVRGPVQIQNEQGQTIDKMAAIVALCRCGRSQRQPLCDGLHAIATSDAAVCGRRAKNARESEPAHDGPRQGRS